ncbi:MAG: hypothetical protein IH899_06180, partial [Planctomycetes bacterium]|nr:hypothetical protein [Planctomycetota bacterium]
MPRDRQLLLAFGETQSDKPIEPSRPTRSVVEITASLRPRIAAYLHQAGKQVSIYALRSEMGYSGLDSASDPQSNPVNRILKEMRDAGEIVCHERDWGEPWFSLPQAERPSAVVTRDSHSKGVESLEQQRPAPELVRPDRQFTFDGQPFYEWPQPTHDRDSITVDRISDDIDGPAHRFLIRRGDTVEVFFSKDKQELGEVVGISQARQEVRVCFREGTKGIWFAVGQIYPAVEAMPAKAKGQRLSEVVAQASCEPPGGFTAADRVEYRSFTFDDFREYRTQFEHGNVTLVDHQAAFRRLVNSKQDFVTALQKRNAQQLKMLASRFGCFDAKRNSKQKNAEHVYRVVVQSFVLGSGIQYDPMRETVEDAACRLVEGITDENWQAFHAKRAAEEQEREQALQDPQTLDQFRLFVRERGFDALSDEQSIRFDQLSADATRAKRKAAKPAIVEHFSSEEIADLQFTIKQGWHDKRQVDLWIVQMDQRVERSTFNELKAKARQLGGWYSSFKKADAGFQFTSEDVAQRFVSLSAGDADRSDVLADRKARKMDAAGAHLALLADTLERDAEETLEADTGKLKNTVRRSEMAAGMRGRAYANQAMAGTLRRLVAALESGEAHYLDGVRAGTQVTALIGLLRRGKTKRNQQLLVEQGELGVWDRQRATEELDHRPLAREDAAFAEYPFPSISRHHFQELLASAANTKGLKQLSRRMQPYAIGDREQYCIEFVDQRDIELLLEYLG